MDPNLTKSNPVPSNPGLGNMPDNSAFPWTTGSHPQQPPSTVASPAAPSVPAVASTIPQTVQSPQTFAAPISPPSFAPVQMPSASFPQVSAAPYNNPPPPAGSPPIEEHHLPASSGNKKFPLMMITGIVLVVITGFSGSYIYFRTQSKAGTPAVAPKITPPVKETPVPTLNPEDKSNPFDNTSEENPFSNEASYANPFGEDESDLTAESYQNPFETEEK